MTDLAVQPHVGDDNMTRNAIAGDRKGKLPRQVAPNPCTLEEPVSGASVQGLGASLGSSKRCGTWQWSAPRSAAHQSRCRAPRRRWSVASFVPSATGEPLVRGCIDPGIL